MHTKGLLLSLGISVIWTETVFSNGSGLFGENVHVFITQFF